MIIIILLLTYFISVTSVLTFVIIENFHNNNLPGFITYTGICFVLFLGIMYLIYTYLKIVKEEKNKNDSSHLA
jgi:hypothetical protein